MFDFSKKIEIKQKETVALTTKIFTEELEVEEYEQAVQDIEAKNIEIETFVTEQVTILEDPVLYVDMPETIKVEFETVIRKTKEKATNQTEGIKIQTNIAKIKVDAKKELKVLQDEITDRMLNLTTADTTAGETEIIIDEEVVFDEIFVEMEERA